MAVERVYGADVSHAQLTKHCGSPPEPETRYSPPECIGTTKRTVMDNPAPEHISASYVERHSLSMRMGIRRDSLG